MKSLNYNIAYHHFTLSMGSSDALWNYMDNYHPFLTTEQGAELVFTLSVVGWLPIDRNCFKPVLTDRRKEADIIALDLYKNEQNDYLIEIKVTPEDSINALLLLNSTFNQARIQLSGTLSVQACALNRAIMLTYLLATANKDTLLMHASVISSNGKGYLFMGKSGTGKSTHSKLWKQCIPDSELMNDDNPIVRITDGQALVFGSPWSGKIHCYRNVSAPIGGFVRLKQAKKNKIYRQKTIESYASLMSSSSGMSWEKRTADGKDSMMQQLIKKIPCWLLECLPDETAARLCANIIRKETSCNG